MRTSATVRIVVMAVLLVGLSVPLLMVRSVVSERASWRDTAANEVSETWGGAQTLAGAMLVIPYRFDVVGEPGRTRQETNKLVVLPKELHIEGTVAPSARARGIFEVIVYQAALKVRGTFTVPDFSQLRPAPVEILWGDATLSVGLSDPKGIARSATLQWNGRAEMFAPGVTDGALFSLGVHAAAKGLSSASKSPVPFEFELELNGTRDLRFLPVGDETTVQLTSAWRHPSFVGAPLPASREISGSGFTASWRVPYFGRGYAPQWLVGGVNRELLQSQAAGSAFGVTLMQPVDVYLQSERAVKYAALFIVFTFVAGFLWEVTCGVLVHPVQYTFIGFALCVFYLLLLSLAEHIGFDRAYIAAAGATILLIASYWGWVLTGARHAVVMSLTLALLYGYLYLLLRLEDFALLAGSVGLFVMLAVVMFVTRRVNWYELRLGTKG